MKHKLVWTLGFIVLGIVVFGVTPAGAATAAGPYYATPSWDQQLPASTRFVVLSNWIDTSFPSGGAAVLDRETGLVWERSPSRAAADWDSAHFTCNTLTLGNRKGWRLPTIQELASLVDPSVSFPGPTLPSGHPFDTNCSVFKASCVQSCGEPVCSYWSATTFVGATLGAWAVRFFNGDVHSDEKDDNLSVWCVRGGQGVNSQ